jgi:surface-adhesin protein E
VRALRGLAALALFGGAGPAAAADWYLTSESAYATNVSFIDKDSILAAGTIRQAQLYMVLAEADDEGAAAIDVRMEYDCSAPRRRFLRLVGFDEAGRQVYDNPGSRIWAPVVRGTQDNAARDSPVRAGGRWTRRPLMAPLIPSPAPARCWRGTARRMSATACEGRQAQPAGAGPFCCQSSILIPSQSRIQAKLP